MDTQNINTLDPIKQKWSRKKVLITTLIIWAIWTIGFGTTFTSLYAEKIFGFFIYECHGTIIPTCTITTEGFFWILVSNLFLGLLVLGLYKILGFITDKIFRVHNVPANNRVSLWITVILLIIFVWFLHKVPDAVVSYAEKNNCNLVFDGQHGSGNRSGKNRQECFMKLAVNKLDSSLCNEINDFVFSKGLCYWDIAVKTKNVSLCNSIVGYEPTKCVEEISKELNDASLCNTLQDKEGRAICILHSDNPLAEKISVSMCQDIKKYGTYRDECFLRLATESKDKKYCEYIKDSILLEYNECLTKSTFKEYCEGVRDRSLLRSYDGCLKSF